MDVLKWQYDLDPQKRSTPRHCEITVPIKGGPQKLAGVVQRQASLLHCQDLEISAPGPSVGRTERLQNSPLVSLQTHIQEEISSSTWTLSPKGRKRADQREQFLSGSFVPRGSRE